MSAEATPLLDRVPLGRSGLLISPVGVGTWAWGDRLFWGYGAGYDDGDLRAAFDASLQAGVNLFDTAEVYGLGRAERLLGRFAAGNTEAVLATKFFPFYWRVSRCGLYRALRLSLQRMGLERVDLYQIHFPTGPAPIETWMDALADVLERGLVRAVGVSNYSAEQMRRAHAALARRGAVLASNQIEYSLLQRAPEKRGLLDACRELGVTPIAWSPLAQGLLTGKYVPPDLPSGLRGARLRLYPLQRVAPLVALLRAIGQEWEKTPAQVALNWLICKGAVPIPGAKNVQQAQQNAAACGWRLAPDQVAALDAVAEP